MPGNHDVSRCAVATIFRFGSASYATDTTPNIAHNSWTNWHTMRNETNISIKTDEKNEPKSSTLTWRFSRFMIGNEWLRDLCGLSLANLTNSVSLSWIKITNFGSFFAQPRINSEYFGCNFDGKSGLRICKPIANRRFRSCTRHSSVHSSVLLLVILRGPSTSLNSTMPPFCICSTLDANLDVAILRYSVEKSWQVRCCLRNPHWHNTSTNSRHGVSGHGVSKWHGAWQLCGHMIRVFFVQFCLHTSVSLSHWPAWQGFLHLCWPHFNGLWHARPQLKLSWLHGIILRCSCLP